MADPKYTMITREGLEAIVDASTNGTLIELKYFVPIYDWRADTTVRPNSFTDANTNIFALYSDANVTSADIYGEILWKSNNVSSAYDLSLAHTSGSTYSFVHKRPSIAPAPATSYDSSAQSILYAPYFNPQRTNLVEGEPVYDGFKITNTDFTTNITNGSIDNVTDVTEVTGSNPNDTGDLQDRLYDTITYSSLSNELAVSEIKSRAVYTMLLDENVYGSFKFNVIATFAIRRNSKYVVEDETPFLFSLTVIPNVVIKSNTIENALQSFSFDINLDFVFSDDSTFTFNKILYVDTSEERALGWHTKQSGIIGTTRNVSIFEKYNAADFEDISKLLVGVTKYQDADGNIITALPQRCDAYQDQTDAYPTNWKTYKVFHYTNPNGIEITFEGDYSDDVYYYTGSGLGNLFGYYPKSDLYDNYEGYQKWLAPSLGLASDNIDPTKSHRWESLNTLNGFTALNSKRIHPLWDYARYNGLHITSAQDYAENYMISGDVLTGFNTENLSYLITNNIEFLYSDAPAYTQVTRKKVLKTSTGFIVYESLEDVWNPFFGVFGGDVYKHWIRTTSNEKRNQDLFFRTDIINTSLERETATSARGDIFILAGLEDTNPVTNHSSRDIFDNDDIRALRRLCLKALEIDIKCNIIPKLDSLTLGTSAEKFKEIHTKALNNWKVGVQKRSSSKPTLYYDGAASSGGEIGRQEKPLDNVYTKNTVTERINDLSLGWSTINTANFTVSSANKMQTSGGSTITTANINTFISNFVYCASPDKTVVVKFQLSGKVTSGSGAMPYIDMGITDSGFLQDIIGGRADEVRFILAVPFAEISSGNFNSMVQMIFNGDVDSTSGITLRSISTVQITSSNIFSYDYNSTDWWTLTSAVTTSNSTMTIVGTLTDNTTFDFSDFASWFALYRNQLISANNDYCLPFRDSDGTWNYSTNLSSGSAAAIDFVRFAEIASNNNYDGTNYLARTVSAWTDDLLDGSGYAMLYWPDGSDLPVPISGYYGDEIFSGYAGSTWTSTNNELQTDIEIYSTTAIGFVEGATPVIPVIGSSALIAPATLSMYTGFGPSLGTSLPILNGAKIYTVPCSAMTSAEYELSLPFFADVPWAVNPDEPFQDVPFFWNVLNEQTGVTTQPIMSTWGTFDSNQGRISTTETYWGANISDIRNYTVFNASLLTGSLTTATSGINGSGGVTKLQRYIDDINTHLTLNGLSTSGAANIIIYEREITFDTSALDFGFSSLASAVGDFYADLYDEIGGTFGRPDNGFLYFEYGTPIVDSANYSKLCLKGLCYYNFAGVTYPIFMILTFKLPRIKCIASTTDQSLTNAFLLPVPIGINNRPRYIFESIFRKRYLDDATDLNRVITMWDPSPTGTTENADKYCAILVKN